MPPTPIRPLLSIALAAGAAALATACGSDTVPADATRMSFELTDAGCVPRRATAPAGPVAFDIENTGSSAVTEFEVLDGDAIVGEAENISEGLEGSFSVELEKGEYTLYCPGGERERGTLTVTR